MSAFYFCKNMAALRAVVKYSEYNNTTSLRGHLKGTPTRPTCWGKEEPPHKFKAYQPDMPNEYGVRRRSGNPSQWRLANRRHSLLLERCCMGVVSQIKDLDNSSSVTFGDSSPVYGFCNPNHRFGQNLTFTKGSLMISEQSPALLLLIILRIRRGGCCRRW